MNYLDEIINEIEKKHLKVDIDKIKLAFYFAEESHIGQYRKSGEDYIMHPTEVTKILIDMKMDTDTIVAGILHDIVEDTLITIADIKYNFGDTVAMLVDGVTKLKTLPNGTKKQDENIRKMILAMAQNIRVIIIKLADRLHNMRTMKYMKPEKQIRISRETLDIYAPLAHRLGIAKIKWELEDLSLRYLKPEEYKYIKSLIDEKRDERREYIEDFIKKIKLILHETGIKGSVKGRFKHFYSIYKKMYEKHKEFDDIYDLMGVRIIVDTEGECYNTLGVIHSHFRPVPGRFKDYIAVPKSNNYQSIHTTIVGPQGKFVEIQIRTEEMDKVAEEGVAAHWSYKEHTKVTKSDQIYTWLRNILELQNEAETAQEFVDSVTKDIMNETVFVFSPKGDIEELPIGATPVDFAFVIHTQVGCKCVGAKVNGKIVPLDYKLQNGDRIEIITSKNSKGPNKDWLDIVVTHGAKSKIKKLLKEQFKDDIIKVGKDNFEKELSKLRLTLKEAEENEIVKKFMEKNSFKILDEFYYAIGESRNKLDTLVDKFKNQIDKNNNVDVEEILDRKKDVVEEKHSKNDGGIIVDGVNNTLVRFAKCCTPLPGDDIGGYVTKLMGIAIHRRDCKNFQNMIVRDPEREVEVQWDKKIISKKENKYKFIFNVLAYEKSDILMQIVNMISNHKISLAGINSHEIRKDGKKLMNFEITIEILAKEEYKRLLNSILKLKDVISVDRT